MFHDKYLSGYTLHGGFYFETIEEAKQKCTELYFEKCGGVTFVQERGYSPRIGSDGPKITSKNGRVSYLRPKPGMLNQS